MGEKDSLHWCFMDLFVLVCVCVCVRVKLGWITCCGSPRCQSARKPGHLAGCHCHTACGQALEASAPFNDRDSETDVCVCVCVCVCVLEREREREMKEREKQKNREK